MVTRSFIRTTPWWTQTSWRERARGLRVNAWTAEDDSPQRLAALIAFGIDGLITGAPEIALDLLRVRERAALAPRFSDELDRRTLRESAQLLVSESGR